MRRQKWLFPLSAALILVALLAACGPKATPTATPKPATFDPRPYIGRYEGAWTNQTIGTTGTVTVEIRADLNRRTASVALTFTGPYLGMSAPLAATVSGGWDATRATVTGKSTITGDLEVTVDMAGNIKGTMKGAGEGQYAEITLKGVITAQRIDVDYVTTGAGGQTIKSIARLTKK